MAFESCSGYCVVIVGRLLGADWATKDGEVAYAAGIVSSDGAPATLEVRCGPTTKLEPNYCSERYQ